MEEFKVTVCPGTLAPENNTYSRKCLKKVFKGRKVSHILPYHAPHSNEEDDEKFIGNRKRISISGFQEKLSFKLDKNKLRLTNENEQGDYILKPIPSGLKNADQLPANEHLTMQIANQIYGLNTAENALIFFKNGEPAYITRRFDIKENKTKWGIEDMASLAERSVDTDGRGFKYDAISYEEIAEIMKKYIAAYTVEIGKFYQLVIFNFLFSNGDAHLKNFSLMETQNGDYILSPAYDLLNTRLHIADTPFALSKGLFKDDFNKEKRSSKSDFLEFGSRIGLKEQRMNKLLIPFLEKQEAVYSLIERSFLSDSMKRAYVIHYNTRLNMLNS